MLTHIGPPNPKKDTLYMQINIDVNTAKIILIFKIYIILKQSLYSFIVYQAKCALTIAYNSQLEKNTKIPNKITKSLIMYLFRHTGL